MIKIAKNQKRKNRKLKKRFIVLFFIVVLIMIFIMINNSLNEINNNNNDEDISEKAELSQENNMTSEDIYQKYECENIESEYVDNNLQINLDFSKDLFSENNSNQKYFDNIIESLVKVYNRDFILKDKNKNITISVKVNSPEDYTYTINNIQDYFKQAEEKNKEINNYKEIKSTPINNLYSDFEKFNLNSWSARAAGIKIKETGKNYLDYGTYKVLTNNTFINTIILKPDFPDEVIEEIKVGDSFTNIKNRLGEPTFKNNNFLGYKTDSVYAFFYTDEVAIYPNISFQNLQLEELITKYINGEYSSTGRFSYDVIHTYLDFNSYVDEQENVNIESPVRGIKITITKNGDLSAQIYNNYDITETTKKYIREDIIKTDFETDLINEYELNRK